MFRFPASIIRRTFGTAKADALVGARRQCNDNDNSCNNCCQDHSNSCSNQCSCSHGAVSGCPGLGAYCPISGCRVSRTRSEPRPQVVVIFGAPNSPQGSVSDETTHQSFPMGVPSRWSRSEQVIFVCIRHHPLPVPLLCAGPPAGPPTRSGRRRVRSGFRRSPAVAVRCRQRGQLRAVDSTGPDRDYAFGVP